MLRVAVLTVVGFVVIVVGWAVWGYEQNACDTECHVGVPVFIACAVIGICFVVAGGFAAFGRHDE